LTLDTSRSLYSMYGKRQREHSSHQVKFGMNPLSSGYLLLLLD